MAIPGAVADRRKSATDSAGRSPDKKVHRRDAPEAAKSRPARATPKRAPGADREMDPVARPSARPLSRSSDQKLCGKTATRRQPRTRRGADVANENVASTRHEKAADPKAERRPSPRQAVDEDS
jgi:hypothetical protein